MVQLPRYRQMADQIKQAVREGVLPPDSRLPSVRVLAAQYNVSLTTALKVLRTLEDEHVAVARPKSGFFVAPVQPAAAESRSTETHTADFAPLDEQTELHMSMVGEECRVRLDLANGRRELYPVRKLSLIMRQLSYSKPFLLGDSVKGTGYAPLKEEIARRAVSYGCHITPETLLITNGCIEALSLALRATLSPGDAVAVESPVTLYCYRCCVISICG